MASNALRSNFSHWEINKKNFRVIFSLFSFIIVFSIYQKEIFPFLKVFFRSFFEYFLGGKNYNINDLLGSFREMYYNKSLFNLPFYPNLILSYFSPKGYFSDIFLLLFYSLTFPIWFFVLWKTLYLLLFFFFFYFLTLVF